MRRASPVLVGLVCSASVLLAQESLQYWPTADTLRYLSDNTYLMYFVRGADTLGQPVASRTRELQIITSSPAGLDVWVRLQGLDAPFSRTDQYSATTTGRVIAANGIPVANAPHARVDLFPRLPTTPVSLGESWEDTVSVRHTEPYGVTYYNVRRAYRLARLLDSAGTRIAVLVSTGTMRLRQGGWQDSAQGVVWWQEVAGPVVDTAWFDVHARQLLADVAAMNLVGGGAVGPVGGPATMPTGLRSIVRRVREPHN
ncbi:MAG: hypothetical protein HY560_05910 [Gemmatimonadetes bacterium]|nr:hypothetical protein [Gemmatimonadota bacterium]